MRSPLRPTEELQDQAVVERDDRVGQVLGQEPRSSWIRLGACKTREGCPERIVPGTFAPLAERQRIPLSLAAAVLDVHERDRRASCTGGREAARGLEHGNDAPLSREPARVGEGRDVR